MPHLGQHDGGKATDRRLVHILRQLKCKLSGPHQLVLKIRDRACLHTTSEPARAWVEARGRLGRRGQLTYIDSNAE